MFTLVNRWLPAELAAWRPAERLRPSAWAEKHRVLPRGQSAFPGPWRNADAPYLAGLMDLCARRDIEEITIVKAVRQGCAARYTLSHHGHA